MPSPITGQATGVGLGTPVGLSATAILCTAFSLKAPLTNSAAVYVGAAGVSSTSGYQLDPGDELSYQRKDQSGQPVYELEPSDFFMVGAAGDRVVWLASP